MMSNVDLLLVISWFLMVNEKNIGYWWFIGGYIMIYDCLIVDWLLYGGLHGHGGTLIAGWFLWGTSPSKIDDDWGYPQLWKPLYHLDDYRWW